jgi:cellulose synthase/poly-beta-1,6-N-acetylglucosamine synthase-like glycosyltransferase
MKLTVLIPTYRRSRDLARCLNALRTQTHPPDAIVLVVRDTDAETWSFLDALDGNALDGLDVGDLPLRPVTVQTTGVIAALNTGLDAVQTDLVAVTDDDAAPRPDWIERIIAHFQADNQIGGVGGRDWVHHGNKLEDASRAVVGKVQWFGRVIGNHHLGVGTAREVDVLKGVNMSFRRAAIAGLHFDPRMRGTGAQVHFETAFSLAVKQAGWKLIYDPLVAVDHYPAQRFDEDQRNQFNEEAFVNAVHNETLALLSYFSPIQQCFFFVWAVLVGTRKMPGLAQWLRFLPKEGHLAGRKYRAALIGRWQGWLTWQQKSGDRPRAAQQNSNLNIPNLNEQTH